MQEYNKSCGFTDGKFNVPWYAIVTPPEIVCATHGPIGVYTAVVPVLDTITLLPIVVAIFSKSKAIFPEATGCNDG